MLTRVFAWRGDRVVGFTWFAERFGPEVTKLPIPMPPTAAYLWELYVARAEDWSGPWLWALDVERKLARRVTSGLEQYTYIAASRDGRRVVATVANPTVNLWRVPIGVGMAEDRRRDGQIVRP